MKTRTLLLLAVAVGLLILIAGTIQLLRIDDSGSSAHDLAIGDSAKAGDLEVTVVSAVERDGVMFVTVRTRGVDDPAGVEDFALVGIGAAVKPTAAEAVGDRACRGLTEAEQTCTLAFATADLDGSTRVLLLRRGEDQRRWSLE
jgi:hypothetical protein